MIKTIKNLKNVKFLGKKKWFWYFSYKFNNVACVEVGGRNVRFIEAENNDSL